jgi:hypothetical protein
VLVALAFPAIAADPLPDYLTKSMEWKNSEGALLRPIHVSLLPDGRLFFFEPAFAMTPTPFWVWRDQDLPDAVTVSPNDPPLVNHLPGVQYDQWHVADTISCAGHTFTDDGRLLVVGGTRLVSDGLPPWLEPGAAEGFGLEDFAAIVGFSSALDFDSATDSWSTLPDSRVLIMAGHNDSGENPGYAQHLDPSDGFSLTPGTVQMPETRGYHTISALLPDGRIFLGGGNNDGKPGNEKPNFRYYYPDYMLKPRPNLLFAQTSFALGDYFWVLTGDRAPISEMVLVALGSMTHSYDMNQRLVELPMVYSSDYGEHTVHFVRAPISAETAPPGDYMLYALDAARVPSVAQIITLTR